MEEYSIKSIRQDFKSKGIFYTPPALGLYMKSLLPDNVNEIYDPTCGNGSLLACFEDSVIKYGQDINKEQIEVANERLIKFNGVVGDTLKEPAFKEKKFDFIIANPPFSINWEQDIDERFNGCPAVAPKSKADYAFILHCLYYLSNIGIAVILGFPGILYRGNKEYEIRKWLIDNNYIEKVISIAGNKFEDTKISTCILVINKNKKNTDVLFIDDEKNKSLTVNYEDIIKNDYNLSVSNFIVFKKEKINIDPIKLEKLAQNNFLNKLEYELLFSKKVCKWENLDFNKFLNKIQNILNKFKENK